MFNISCELCNSPNFYIIKLNVLNGHCKVENSVIATRNNLVEQITRKNTTFHHLNLVFSCIIDWNKTWTYDCISTTPIVFSGQGLIIASLKSLAAEYIK